uniref:Putative secreted protein n=1 Tax=Anopheles marajoara TaxID=58244 RepID=A0A2M4CDF8_9DIPT
MRWGMLAVAAVDALSSGHDSSPGSSAHRMMHPIRPFGGVDLAARFPAPVPASPVLMLRLWDHRSHRMFRCSIAHRPV